MKIDNFAILNGKKTKIKEGSIIYLPEFDETKDGEAIDDKPIRSSVRADKIFYQGTFQFKFKAKNSNTGILIIVEQDGKHISSIGLSYDSKSFIIDDIPSKTYIRAGSLANYEPNSEISLKITWNGSKCKLFVNNVLMIEANNFLPKSMPILLRITSLDEVNLYDFELQNIRPKLFVVMQFSDEYNKLYDDVIFPISERMGFDCVRADEFYTSTPILKDIISNIEESTAIIAEITPDNPNVFYEIGYAHAIQKPTILLCDKKREKLPFDISGFRTLFYENSISGKSKIEKSLMKYLENIKY